MIKLPEILTRLFFSVLLGLILGNSFSQDLVKNGSFEEVNHCPRRFNTGKSISLLAKGWSSASRGTPDIFNTCNKGNLGVENMCGVTYPKTGKGFAGFILYDKDKVHEYLQTKISEPLEKGKKYHLEFYHKYARYSMYEADKLGVGFAKDSTFQDDYFRLKFNANDRIVQSINLIGDSRNWYKFELDYTAKGGEQYLIIGNFERDEALRIRYCEEKEVQEPMLSRTAYYYIDDVSLKEVDYFSELDSVSLSDTLVLRNVHFEFDKYVLKRESGEELDKLAQILKSNPNWKVRINGHTDKKGEESYNLELSKKRAQAVGRYLVSKGISKSRILPKGYGSSVPSKLNTDEENRRVEVEFYE